MNVPTSFKPRDKSEGQSKLMIRTGSKSSTAKVTLTIEPTDGEWAVVSCELTTPITGVQDLFFTMSTPDANLLFDNWQFSGQNTAIRTVNSKSTASSAVYDLQGRRVSPLTSQPSPLKKGLYIVNGKKVVR